MSRGLYLGATPRDITFWQNLLTQVVRNNVWEPLNLDRHLTTVGDWGTTTSGTTTIAAGSNGAILPQATINLASVAPLDVPLSASFPEYVTVTIGGKVTVISYTGINVGANQITGCAGGSGTLTTGDVVSKGHVNWTPPRGTVVNAIAEVAFAANAAGDRGIRFRIHDGLFNFSGGTKTERAANGVHHVQSCEQPADPVAPGACVRLEVFQDSGGPLDAPLVSLAAPRKVAIPIGRLP